MKRAAIWLAVLVPMALAACDNTDAPSDRERVANYTYEAPGDDGILVTGSRVARSEFSSVSPIQVAAGETAGATSDAVDQSEAPEDENPNFLAYSYNMAVEAPAAQINGLFEQHREACLAAGANVCQVINANLSNQVADRVSGRLQIRAFPDWLETFRGTVAADAEAADGRLISETTSAEDLSSPILDTRARLSAQTALRDRLQVLLETEGASVEELIRVERELARVQGDIESATSRLRYLERRVSMSVLAVNYSSEPVPFRSATVNPVVAAFNDFFDIIADGLADVIRVIAAILPWLLLIIPAIYLLRWMWRRRSVKKAAAKGKA